jgi:hypothetical protein
VQQGRIVPRQLYSLPAAAILLAVSAFWSPARGAIGVAVLHWTATGDDALVGTATRYDIRRSLLPITSLNFVLADTVGTPPSPLPAGTPQSCFVLLPNGGVRYYFAVRAVDDAGNWSVISNVVSFVAPVTGVRGLNPGQAAFAPPWPNPARGRVLLGIDVPALSTCELDVFDASGRHVRRLWSGTLGAGPRDFDWNLLDDHGARVQPGVFFARARIGGWSRTRQLVVVG